MMVAVTGLLLGTSAIGLLWGQEPGGQGADVTFRVVDWSGSDFSKDWFVASLRGGGEDRGSAFSGLSASGIPLGSYDYVLLRRGRTTCPLEGRVTVDSKVKLEVVAALFRDLYCVGIDGPADGFLSVGKLGPPPSAGKPGVAAWVRLTSVFGANSAINLPVDASGEFRLVTRLTGRYILTVVAGSEVLASEQVQFDYRVQPARFEVRPPARPLAAIEIGK